MPRSKPIMIVGKKAAIEKMNKAKEKDPFGNSTIYDPRAFPGIAEAACREYGAGTKELSVLFSTTPAMVRYWIEMYPDFHDAVQAGVDYFDCDKAEKALFRRVIGCRVTEKDTTVFPDGGVKEVLKEKEVLPDVVACVFWMQNRNPERWKKIIQSEGDSNSRSKGIKSPIGDKDEYLDLDKMGKDDLEKLQELLSKAARSASVLKGETEGKPPPLRPDQRAVLESDSGRDDRGEISGKKPSSLH